MSLPLQVVSVIVVLRIKNKFLLVQRSLEDDIFPGKWQNVGGKVELGERIEEAIRREVKEEVGLTISKELKYLMSYSWQKVANEPFRIGLIFLVNLYDNFAKYKVKLNSELGNHGWFEFDEVKEMNDKGLLIGKDSPRGTFQQIKAVRKF